MQHTLAMRSVEDIEGSLEGKRVLLRTSLNVPVLANGEVGDVFRLKRELATIDYLAQRGAKIVLVGYIGREGSSLAPVARVLQKLLPHIKITFTDAAIEHVAGLVDALEGGQCLMLENVRRSAGEEKNDPLFAHALASLVDLFVDDAFAEAHRAYASNVGVATLLPAYAGFLMLEEVARLSEALQPPAGAITIIGGAKFETKEPLIARLLTLYEKVCIGGALADDVLKSRGVLVGTSLVSGLKIPESITKSDRLFLPLDAVVLDVATGIRRTADIHDIGLREDALDIGAETRRVWTEEIQKAPFVLWNGPVGAYEKGFPEGTNALAKAIAEGSCRAVIGGGDTAAALAQCSFDPARVFISTGGGAMLEFLANGTLPALEVLKK